MGNFDEVTATRTERVQLIQTTVQLVRCFYELWGRWPTATEIAAQIGVTPKT